jgi:hypothetical protein
MEEEAARCMELFSAFVRKEWVIKNHKGHKTSYLLCVFMAFPAVQSVVV